VIQSRFLQRWDVLALVCLVFTAIVTPVEVAFINKTTLDTLFVINRAIDIVFFIVSCMFGVRPSQPVRGNPSRCL
jgi:hypothetical protein